MNRTDVVIYAIVILVVITIGVTVGTTLMDMDRHCESRFGQGYTALEDYPRPNNSTWTMCQSPDGEIEPLVIKNITSGT